MNGSGINFHSALKAPFYALNDRKTAIDDNVKKVLTQIAN